MAEQPSTTDLVDEGMLLIGASVRLAVKNTLIVSILRDGASWDEVVLLDSMRRDIRSLISERQSDLSRIESAIDRARDRPGQPRAPDDYRRLDVPVLERRRLVNEALTERLRSLLCDDDSLRDQLFAARNSALIEMQQHRWAAVGLMRIRDDPKDRAFQLKQLKRELAAMARTARGSR